MCRLFLATLLFTVPWCSAATLHYVAILTPVNNSGVSGIAHLTLNGDLLSVRI
jgi:hypothetical protein